MVTRLREYRPDMEAAPRGWRLQVVLCALALVFLPVVLATSAQAAEGDRRIALVIGNSRYEHVETLANPVNDSAAMREGLTKLGFEIFGGDDLSLKEFSEHIDKFKAAAETADTALVYYSGHGFQLRGKNYLVPRDARLKAEGDIEAETIRLDRVISDLQSSDRQTLIFLDACRNNPLPPEKRQDDGLAQIETGGNGVFVAFATQPGNISYDGRTKLSPFTRAITQQIDRPGQSISDMMIEVRNEVEKRTLYQQTPWDQSSLRKQFYFNPFRGGSAQPQTASLDLDLPSDDLSDRQRSIEIDRAVREGLAEDQPNVLVLPDAGGVGHPNVILLPEAPIEVFGKEDLVLGVQTELKRVGCYMGEVDGVWSTGSKDALSRYFATKKMSLLDSTPSEHHYDNLKREEGMVCKPPPVVRKAPASSPGRTASGRKASGQVARNAQQVSRPSAPAAPERKTITNTRVLGAFR